jgi:DNA-binding transcriptional regulator YiaG
MLVSVDSDRARLQASARRMRAIRRSLGMTQRDFSYLLRVAVNTVSQWENGHTLPSPLAEQAIRSLAAAEGLDLHTLQPFAS